MIFGVVFCEAGERSCRVCHHLRYWVGHQSNHGGYDTFFQECRLVSLVVASHVPDGSRCQLAEFDARGLLGVRRRTKQGLHEDHDATCAGYRLLIFRTHICKLRDGTHRVLLRLGRWAAAQRKQSRNSARFDNALAIIYGLLRQIGKGSRSLLLGSHPVLVEHAHELSDNDGTIGGLNRQPHERAFGVLPRLIVAAAQEQHERADPSRFGDRSAITPILRKCQQRAGRLFLRLPTRIAAEQINKWADGTGFSDDLGGWGLVGQSLDFADLLLSVTLSNISSRGTLSLLLPILERETGQCGGCVLLGRGNAVLIAEQTDQRHDATCSIDRHLPHDDRSKLRERCGGVLLTPLLFVHVKQRDEWLDRPTLDDSCLCFVIL